MAEPQVEAPTRMSLRIGMVTHYMPPHVGGIEMVAQSLFDTYRREEFDVRWIASRVPSHALPYEDGRVRVGCVNTAERQLGVPWPLWGPSGVREIQQMVEWADVVHVHDCLYFGSAVAVLRCRQVGKPVLLSQHIGFGDFSSRLINAIQTLAYRTLGRAVLKRASQVVFCTPTAREFITELMGRAINNPGTISVGIDTNRFRPANDSERSQARVALEMPTSKRIALFVGRLTEKKGAALFREVTRLLPSYHFLIVGDGPVKPRLAENVTWIPFVEPESMPSIYWSADALLLPSYSEGFPLSVLEAIASGVPVIGPNGEAFALQLAEQNSCLLAERSPQAFAEALNVLFDTPALSRALAQRGRDLVVLQWSAQAMGTQYIDLIRELAARAAR